MRQERSESARERRIALYKSDQQEQQQQRRVLSERRHAFREQDETLRDQLLSRQRWGLTLDIPLRFTTFFSRYD